MYNETPKENQTTVSTYSKNNSLVYDDPLNKNFVYGKITIDFVNSIQIDHNEKVIADIGCGTGFCFDILKERLKNQSGKYIGIDPAKGMLEVAMDKYRSDSEFHFELGSFEEIPLENQSVDKLISTLALHWVPSIEDAVKEMARVLKPDGTIDILMIAKDDGEKFKLPVLAAMKKHLSFMQIMKSAGLARRVSAKQLKKHFSNSFNNRNINVENKKQIIYGNFEEHMKWWKARSEQIIADVKNKAAFMNDLKIELNKINEINGIPFDASVLNFHLKK